MRRTTLVPLALCLALLMLTSSTVTAGGDITMMQAAPNAEQPTAENNTFHLFGRPNAEPCWGHFNNTDAEWQIIGTWTDDIEKILKSKGKFWLAEEYHQDFAERNELKYKFYRFSCGRDQRLDKLWGDNARSTNLWNE